MMETAKPDPAAKAKSDWSPLAACDWLPLTIAVTAATVIAFTRLPPGVCFGDSGDLQLASVTLGIAHPPGYPILSTLGYVLTRIPFVEPAYIITLACALSGAAAAYLCGLMQIRLGVHPLVAAAGVSIFLAHPRVWFNVVGPEVYMPALAMLVGAVYCFIRFATTESVSHFFAATLLFGLTLFTRPPTIFCLPFFLLATLQVNKRRNVSTKKKVKRLAMGTLLIVLPGLYSFGYILARDRNDVAYNYIDVHNAESGTLPASTGGIPARIKRAVWLMTGRQYADRITTSWPQIRSKMNWIRNQAFPVDRAAFAFVLALVGAGGILCWYRHRCAAIVLIGLVIETLVFLSAYQVHGQEANLLPLLLATIVFAGVAVSQVVMRLKRPYQTVVAQVIAIGCVVGATVSLIQRRDMRGLFDASAAIAKADLATFPENSVIISAWGITTPLRYAHFFADRTDIDIETVSRSRWGEFAGKFPGRPVFIPQQNERVSSVYRQKPFRNLYRLVPRKTNPDH